jgi:hypothetical protein
MQLESHCNVNLRTIHILRQLFTRTMDKQKEVYIFWKYISHITLYDLDQIHTSPA